MDNGVFMYKRCGQDHQYSWRSFRFFQLAGIIICIIECMTNVSENVTKWGDTEQKQILFLNNH